MLYSLVILRHLVKSTFHSLHKAKNTTQFFKNSSFHLQTFASHWTASSSAEWSLDKPPSIWVSATEAQVLWVC